MQIVSFKLMEVYSLVFVFLYSVYVDGLVNSRVKAQKEFDSCSFKFTFTDLTPGQVYDAAVKVSLY